MSKKTQSRRADGEHAHLPGASRGGAESPLPPDWVETRAALERRYAFYVRRWYFTTLVVLSIALFAGSFLFNNLWLALASGALAVGLSRWNKRARKASLSGDSRR
jgi:hypothetical protein